VLTLFVTHDISRLKRKKIGVIEQARAQLLATQILIAFCPTIERHCFYALTDLFFPPEGKRSEVARRRQGVTGSEVQFIYLTFSSLMLFNSKKKKFGTF
jgi:hypothetical protein